MSEVYTKICPKCGIEFKTTRDHQKFCSKSCSNRGRKILSGNYDHSLEWKRTAEEGTWECPYQKNVGCYDRECFTCGWYPPVAKARLERYMEEHHEG